MLFHQRPRTASIKAADDFSRRSVRRRRDKHMYIIIWNFQNQIFKTQLNGYFFKDFLRSYIHRARTYFLAIARYPYGMVVDLIHVVPGATDRRRRSLYFTPAMKEWEVFSTRYTILVFHPRNRRGSQGEQVVSPTRILKNRKAAEGERDTLILCESLQKLSVSRRRSLHRALLSTVMH